MGVNGGIRVGGRCALAGKSGDEVDHHADGDYADDDYKNRLGNAVVILQETNHEWT